MSADLLLVIDHKDTTVRMNGRALRIQHADQAPQHIPLGVLGLVIVHGRPLVGCEVWRALAERNIPAVLQPARGRGASVLIGVAGGGGIALRIAQHRAAADTAQALAIARRLVVGKIDAYAEARARLAPSSPASQRLAETQHAAIDRIDTAADNNALMGIEGAAAAAWYAWLADWLPDSWRFSGRNRRPPRDPVNALLSLGYTLLAGEMLRAVQEQGLDPALGFLHGVVPGRESLVLDLIEPLRASVDLVVLDMIADYLLPTQFSYSSRDGCRLNKPGRAAFYRCWAITRNDWPDLSRPPRKPVVVPVPAPVAITAAEAAATNNAPGQSTPIPTAPTAATGADDEQCLTLPQLCRRQVEALARRLRLLGDDTPPAAAGREHQHG